MSSHTRVALVTGANKGIGFAIVRDLCRQFSGDVVLTARDEARGQAAVQRLRLDTASEYDPATVEALSRVVGRRSVIQL